MTEKFQTIHPDGKNMPRIDKAKYDAVKDAILGILADEGEVAFGDLADKVAERVPDFEGSYGWYTTSVKLDLEARGTIKRVPKKSPQRLVLAEVR